MTNLPRFTLRIQKNLLKKVESMAAYNGRSKNKEIETAIKRQIRDFENLHGTVGKIKILEKIIDICGNVLYNTHSFFRRKQFFSKKQGGRQILQWKSKT